MNDTLTNTETGVGAAATPAPAGGDGCPAPGTPGEIDQLRARVAELEAMLSVAAASSAAETRLQVLLDNSPAGIAIWDKDDHLVAFNALYRDLFFRGREHMVRLGDSFTEQSRRFLSSGQVTAIDGVVEGFLRERERRRQAPGDYFEQELGDRRILSRESRTPDGGMISVHMDITAKVRAVQALRESEERFRAMADTMPALLWMGDADGRCVFVNKTWLDYTGRTMEEELGLGWTKAVHPDDLPGALIVDTEARRDRKPFTQVYRLRRADDEYRWFLNTGAPRFATDGRFLWLIGTLLDITDQRRLEAELHQAQKVEAIGQLTGGVAHDFNNLLTVISGNLELAASRVEDPRVAAMLRLAMDAAERGASLTQRLLAFGRRQALSPQVLEIAELVTAMSELLRRTLGGGIEIAISSPAGLWPALVDRSQLENAILNLAINARDAMPEGGRLTIETANREIAAGEIAQLRPGRYVALTVSDTGHGMTAEVREKAVQPFFTTKDTGKGSGLGLSMVYGFAKQSGGHLRIDSEPGRGATIRLLLPAAAAGAHKPRSTERGRDEVLGFAPGSALVVDDDPDVLNVAVSMLEGIGYRVTTAADGASALTWIAEGGPFDLLLTDIVLPGGMNGVQLAAAIQERRPGIKVLLMSGYTERALDEGGISAPLLQKPFRRQELVQRLREVFTA